MESKCFEKVSNSFSILKIIRWATSWENLFLPYANNKGTDQAAHLRSLISAFVVRCLDSIIPLVSISQISSLYLASMAAQAGFCLTWSKTLKTGFLVMGLRSFLFWITSPWYMFWVFRGKSCIASLSFEPQHDKTKKMMCVPSKDSNQPWHSPSLISLRCALYG